MNKRLVVLFSLVVLSACRPRAGDESKSTYLEVCTQAVNNSELAKTSGTMVSIDQILTGQNKLSYSLSRVVLAYNGPNGSAATIKTISALDRADATDAGQFCWMNDASESEFGLSEIDRDLLIPHKFDDLGKTEDRLDGKIKNKHGKIKTTLFILQGNNSNLRDIVQGVQNRGGSVSFQMDERNRDLHVEIRSSSERQGYVYVMKVTYSRWER